MGCEMTVKLFNGNTSVVLRMLSVTIATAGIVWGVVTHLDTKIEHVRKESFSRNEAALIIRMVEKVDSKIERVDRKVDLLVQRSAGDDQLAFEIR